MGSFTDTHEYTNDPDTLPKDIQDFREKLEEKAKQKGALGTVADGDIKITATYVSSKTPTIDNPLTFSPKDAFKLRTRTKNHYLRFGALLEYIKDKFQLLLKITR
jgi:hypothetical protein